MTTPDLINGLFEGFGSIAAWVNIRSLYRSKELRGYSLYSQIFFTSWGIWNMYYYPHLHQWASTVAGGSLCIANLVYVVLVIHYRRVE